MLCILCDNCDIQVHKQATLTSLLFCWEAEIRYQDGPDECVVEIGICWEPEGATLKLSADLFGRPLIILVNYLHKP